MGKTEKTYYDYASNEHKYLLTDYQNGRVADYMGAASQNTCERYLKHIVEVDSHPSNEEESFQKKEILRTHNLKKLMRYIKNNTSCDFTSQESLLISSIDGFYFTTRYPGEESESIDKEDLDNCMAALDICEQKARAYTRIQDNQLNQEDFEME